MRRYISRILKLMLLVVFLVLAIAAYPFVKAGIGFELRRSEIVKLVETADPADRSLPQTVRDLLLLSLGGTTVLYASRLSIWELGAWPSHEGALSRIAFDLTWSALIALHFSEQDRLTLIARLARTGKDRVGLSHTAEAIYHRPLSALSLTEAGTLIALTKSPSIENNPKRLSDVRDWLLSRYENAR